MSVSVLVPVANGSEELETITIVDVLRRAEAEVVLASVESEATITASRGTKITADCLIGECADREFDLIAVPGGMPGAQRIGASEPLVGKLREQAGKGGYYGAICAAPEVVLASNDLLGGKMATGHPMFRASLDLPADDRNVVIDGNCITSKGAGTAMEFALELVEALLGAERRSAVEEGLVVARGSARAGRRTVVGKPTSPCRRRSDSGIPRRSASRSGPSRESPLRTA